MPDPVPSPGRADEPPAVAGLVVDVDDPLRPDVLTLLGEHLDDMRATSPPESVHALDPTALARPGVTFWSAREGGVLVGCVALAELPPAGGELKSMRTTPSARGRGVGAALLAHALAEAAARGYRTVHLETGTQDFFAAAHRLYARAGFVPCGPFGSYVEDPNSRYLRLDLTDRADAAPPPGVTRTR